MMSCYGVMLSNNEVKDNKLFKSLENSENFLRGTTRKIISQVEGLLNFLEPLMKVGLPLLRKVLTPLAENVLLSFGVTGAGSATEAAIQKKIYGSGMTPLIISNKEIKDIMEMVKYVVESSLFNKGICKTIENEVKEQNGGFLGILAATLGAILLVNILTDKGVKAKIPRWGIVKAGKEIIRAGQNF